MNQQHLDTDQVELITFDCYGTLVDWESGIRAALGLQLQAAGLSWQERFFELYLEYESREQCQTYRPYKEILTIAEAGVLSQAGVEPLPKPMLAASLGAWRPFDDTVPVLEGLRQKFKLGVLSNIDRDLFAQTARQLRVRFDVVVTAEDVRYYKPGSAHFDKMLELTGLDKHRVLHVAQSLYHDIRPCKDMKIPCVWINRRGQQRPESLLPLAEFPDLKSFAAAVL